MIPRTSTSKKRKRSDETPAPPSPHVVTASPTAAAAATLTPDHIPPVPQWLNSPHGWPPQMPLNLDAKIDLMMINLRCTYEFVEMLVNEVKMLKKTYTENECWDQVRVS